MGSKSEVKPEVAEHYSAHYRDFAADVYGDVRREAFGVMSGRTTGSPWTSSSDSDRSFSLRPSARFLDIACGSGGPTLHLARLAECDAVGVELYEEAVATGRRGAADASLEGRVTFVCADAGRRLPFESESFDAALCVDAINHLPDRRSVLTDWARLLRPGTTTLHRPDRSDGAAELG